MCACSARALCIQLCSSSHSRCQADFIQVKCTVDTENLCFHFYQRTSPLCCLDRKPGQQYSTRIIIPSKTLKSRKRPCFHGVFPFFCLKYIYFNLQKILKYLYETKIHFKKLKLNGTILKLKKKRKSLEKEKRSPNKIKIYLYIKLINSHRFINTYNAVLYN